jgi:formylglycine-generating enzyme required for sulfatase activity
VEAKKQSETEYLVTAKSGAEQASEKVRAGSEVLVSWTQEDREPEDGGTESPKDMGADLASPPDLSQPEDLATAPTEPDLGAAVAWSCPYEEKTIQGVVFVKVCGGDFVMGSAQDDREADGDEKPAHPVHVDTFWIGKYEVSNDQYRKKEPGHKSTFDGDNLPVQDVDWNQASAYCRSIGGGLPTETEWEYAARGPEGRKYPWGKAKPQPGRATFNRAYRDGPEAITENAKGWGPFGTLNQAGNVWEWCLDWYDDYKVTKDNDKIVMWMNPFGPPSGSRRVVRGGSFWVAPRSLRSAVRSRNVPEFRSRDFGFRCVRDSGRQP